MVAVSFAQQIAVLFLMMGMGALLVRGKVVQAADSRVLSVAAIYIISPCVILKAFQIDYEPEIRDSFLLAILAALIIHVVLFAVAGILGRALQLDVVERASIIYPNCANLTLPLVIAVLGDEWVIYASAYICVQVSLLFTHCQSMMSGKRSFSIRHILTNVNLIAIAAGIMMFLTGLRLPGLVYDAVSGMAACIGPISMLMLGMIMTQVDWKKTLTNKRLYVVAFTRLIVIPVIVVCILKFSGLSQLVPEGSAILLVSLLGAAGPAAAMVTQFAQLYGRDEKYASGINAVTTLGCLVTMPLAIALYTL